MSELTQQDKKDIEEILRRRANEIASFKTDYCSNPSHFGSVELALSREIERLRGLSAKINPLVDEEDDA